MTIPANHLAYHWGQLCYMQTLWGDDKDHFLDPSYPLGSRYWGSFNPLDCCLRLAEFLI